MSNTTENVDLNEDGTRKLSASWVEEVLLDCLYSAEELEAATKDERGAPTGAVVVTGIVSVYGFHPERLAGHKDEIITMLGELPEEFKIKPSGGWSFLQACNDRHGEQWTGLQVAMEQVFCLGMAVRRVMLLTPREMWNVLPGGMPYYAVTDEDIPEDVAPGEEPPVEEPVASE